MDVHGSHRDRGTRQVGPAPQNAQLAADGQEATEAVDAAAHEVRVDLVDAWAVVDGPPSPGSWKVWEVESDLNHRRCGEMFKENMELN